MNIKLLISGLAIGFSLSIFAQQKVCDGHSKNAEYMQNHESFRNAHQKLEQEIQEYALTYKPKHAASNEKTAVRTINVVVHLIYEDQVTEDLTDAQVQAAIDSLNNDFRGLNEDGYYNPSQAFFDLWADTQIEFVLASTDPDGNSTTGITRLETTNFNFTAQNEEMKSSSTGGVDNWDPQRYLNVWVCHYTSPGSSGTPLGYAYYPPMLGDNPSLDGCVINYPYFAIGSVYKGRTLTHEIGHYLNLDHIFGDETGCADDAVTDTPVPQIDNGGCPTYPHNANNGCTNGTDAEGEMYMNYMDYVSDDCMYMFTMGQSTRMNAVLDGIRRPLWDPTATTVKEKKSFTFEVYPNPAQNKLQFMLDVNKLENIVVVNMLGERIDVDYSEMGRNFNVDVSEIDAGLYTILVKTDNNTFISKFIKQ